MKRFPKTVAREFLQRFSLVAFLYENRIFRVCGGVTLLSAAVAIVLLIFVHRFITDIRDAQEITQGHERIARQVEALLGDLGATRNEQALLSVIRVPRDAPLEFIRNLEALAARVGVAQTLEALPASVQQPAGPNDIPLLRYQLTLEGSLDGVTAYLRDLASIPQIVAVEEVSMGAGEQGNIVQAGTARVRIAVVLQK